MQQLKKNLIKAGISVNNEQLSSFQKYQNLLLDWNQKTNLISKADESRIVERHFLESLAVLPAIKIKQNAAIIDVGSGAGFPALPISLLRSDLKIILVESKRLKTLFLKDAITCLKLGKVTVLNERCENLSDNSDYHNCFDYAFSRAVGKLDVVYGWVQKLLKAGGLFVAWKGGNVEPEIKKLLARFGTLDINTIKTDDRLVDSKQERSLVIVQQR